MSMIGYKHEVGDLVALTDSTVCMVTEEYHAYSGATFYLVDRDGSFRAYLWDELEPIDDHARNMWNAALKTSMLATSLNRIALVEEQIHTASQRHDGWVRASSALEDAMRLSTDDDALCWFVGAPRKSKSAERRIRALRRLLK